MYREGRKTGAHARTAILLRVRERGRAKIEHLIEMFGLASCEKCEAHLRMGWVDLVERGYLRLNADGSVELTPQAVLQLALHDNREDFLSVQECLAALNSGASLRGHHHA